MKITTLSGKTITLNTTTANLPGIGQCKVHRVYKDGEQETLNVTHGFQQILAKVPAGTMAKYDAMVKAAAEKIEGTFPCQDVLDHDRFLDMMGHEDETMMAQDNLL